MAQTGFYAVYIKPDNVRVAETAQFVRQGFNIWAAITTFFWLFYKRLWLWGTTVFVLLTAISYFKIQGTIDWEITYSLRAGLLLYLGFTGQDLVEKNLENRGYILAAVVTARDELEAQTRFFDQYSVRTTELPQPPSSTTPIQPAYSW